MNDPKYWNDLIARSASRFFFLAGLARKPMHGYELAKTIASDCNNCCTPSDAMIYPAIRDMTRAGLIDCEEEVHEGRTRKVCRLTEAGWEAYRAAALAWAEALPALERAVAAGLEPAGGDRDDPEEPQIDPGCCR
jgi:PadR family transcriptional regulator PadR